MSASRRALGQFALLSAFLGLGLGIFVLHPQPSTQGTVAIPSNLTHHEPSKTWQVGFWYWWMSSRTLASHSFEPGFPDDLYVQVGSVSRRNSAGSAYTSKWPDSLPEVKHYWAVWRFEDGDVLNPETFRQIAGDYNALLRAGAASGRHVAGIQIDFDCPTSRLSEYAAALRELRSALPSTTPISITALLDWFVTPSAIAKVLEQVDQYVPQFFDVGREYSPNESSIAAKIDAARWAPVFNAYRIPYRIGIGAFGRIVIHRRKQLYSPSFMTPLEFWTPADLRLVGPDPNAAGEVVIRREAGHPLRVFRENFIAGDFIEMILPTAASIHSAYVAANAMGGSCTGVVFFRWTAESESMALYPEEVRTILAGRDPAPDSADRVETKAGDCAILHCTDLYLIPGSRMRRDTVEYDVEASADLEYFLGAPDIRVQMRGTHTVTATLPPFAVVPRIRLGRAVSKAAVQFSVRRKP